MAKKKQKFDVRIRAKGVALDANKPISGRIYSEESLLKSVEEFNKKGPHFGMLVRGGGNDTEPLVIGLSKISHEIRHLDVEKGKLMVDLDILKHDTPCPAQIAEEVAKKREAYAACRALTLDNGIGQIGEISQILSVGIVSGCENPDGREPLVPVKHD